jgi:hypothetical protein
MVKEEPRPSEGLPTFLRVLMYLGIPVIIAGFAAFDRYMRRIPAAASAEAFVVAVRAGHLDEVRAHTTRDLGARLDPIVAGGSGQTELARAYERVRTSKSIRSDFVAEDWSKGCMDGKVEGAGPLWLPMSKEHGQWVVADMRIDSRPNECDVSGGD